MLSTIGFAAATVAPIFLLIFTGIILRQTGVIDKAFIATGSNIVFKIALPAMVFLKMSTIKKIPAALWEVIILFVAVTLVLYGILWIAAGRQPVRTHSAFIQGASRGNITIIGLAVVENAFGLEAMQSGVVVLMVMMPLYNILAIIVLSRCQVNRDKSIFIQAFFKIVKNPLIWAIAIGVTFGLSDLRIPAFASRTLGYLSQLTMPLALISIGGSLTLQGLKKRRALWAAASVSKLVVLPLLVWSGTMILGISGNAQYAVVLASACPSAVSSFAMAQAMGADAELAGEIVSATTLFSILSLTFWIVLLV